MLCTLRLRLKHRWFVFAFSWKIKASDQFKVRKLSDCGSPISYFVIPRDSTVRRRRESPRTQHTKTTTMKAREEKVNKNRHRMKEDARDEETTTAREKKTRRTHSEHTWSWNGMEWERDETTFEVKCWRLHHHSCSFHALRLCCFGRVSVPLCLDPLQFAVVLSVRIEQDKIQFFFFSCAFSSYILCARRSNTSTCAR